MHKAGGRNATRLFQSPEADRLTRTAIGDFEFVVTASAPWWSKLAEHGRGELLGALADGWLQLGDVDKAALSRPHDQRTAGYALRQERRHAPRRSGGESAAHLPWMSLRCACVFSCWSQPLWLLAVSGAANAETVTFQSGSYADFRQLLAREAPAATVHLRDAALSRRGAGSLSRRRDRAYDCRLSGVERRLARRRISQSRLRHPDL